MWWILKMFEGKKIDTINFKNGNKINNSTVKLLYDATKDSPDNSILEMRVGKWVVYAPITEVSSIETYSSEE